jgi:large subunit ribosomal protein L24
MRLSHLLQNPRKKFHPHQLKPIQRVAKEKMEQNTKWDILRGDKVQVINKHHVEYGKQGVVQKVLRKHDSVIISGLYMATRHIKGNVDKGIPGRKILKERMIPVSQVSLLDPVQNSPTKVYYKTLDDGSKVRVSKKSDAVIPRPDILLYRKRPVNSLVTDKDTTSEHAWSITYEPAIGEPLPPPRYRNVPVLKSNSRSQSEAKTKSRSNRTMN